MRSAFAEEYELCLAALIEARRKAGLTQQALAKRLRKHQSFIAKYETSQRRLDIAEFFMIARIIGVLPPAMLKAILNAAPHMNIRHRSRPH